MNLYGSFIAILCYMVTVLLLYFVGDMTNIAMLQFSKETTLQSEISQYASRSFAPLLLALPVYIIVLYKSKKI
ncbi:hypothetical protein [Bacillus multifaciens]|uniref:hypothetical protein n=1 Tax=Bacillus multifaciens TaxID=3068506 RepID=UPI002740D5E2|nr:hypothetical protein [Bacillus sp. WLY-B-L8]MDP7976975.1 hypothetical protein [Bacillus sp. WLY-B-L8]HDX9589168.1 hypothetical protein [Bacillus pseudomycoides]